LDRRLKNPASLTPCLRHRSAAVVLAQCLVKIQVRCSSLKQRLFSLTAGSLRTQPVSDSGRLFNAATQLSKIGHSCISQHFGTTMVAMPTTRPCGVFSFPDHVRLCAAPPRPMNSLGRIIRSAVEWREPPTLRRPAIPRACDDAKR
jgi:hypothetical protein